MAFGGLVSTSNAFAAAEVTVTASEALRRSLNIPAVMLLDLKLPKVDGLEVLQTVRSSETLRSIPVVMLTSSREEPDLARAYELGVNAYVVKPVEFKDFVAAALKYSLEAQLMTTGSFCPATRSSINALMRSPQKA